MGELFKCFLYGFAGLASLVLTAWLTYALLPWSGYVWGGLIFVGLCTGLGADMRSGRCPR